jgi:predicted transcriptional regulator/transcriptional regulator with XRE-family HTH domain
MATARLGGKLRRLRRERHLTQSQMAAELGLSASYLNLLEHNQRPVTVPVLIKLAQRFAVDMESFNGDDDARLLSDLMEAFADPLFDTHEITSAELKELVSLSPSIGQAMLTLYQAFRSGSRTKGADASTDDDSIGDMPAGIPSEEVSDFLQQRGNYFHVLELAAESLWADHGLSLATLYQDLIKVLAERYAVDVVVLPAAAMGGALREYKPLMRRLGLSELLPISSRAFQLAHQLALLGWHKELELATARGKFTSEEGNLLARVALANYFAGAVMMPYQRFLEAAIETRYDLAILEHRFGASFEQVCHRLTTLHRPGAEGLAFHLIRVDIAGNISKRFSASGIPIARFGAACPRWNVYDAFATPGMLRIQVSEMPTGEKFFCVARTISPAGRPAARSVFGQRVSRLSIGLGCALSEARRLVYSDGVALDDPQIVTPIGVNCRICERPDCADRATPSMRLKLTIDEDRRGLSAYSAMS